MNVLAAVFGLALAWGLHLAGGALAHRAGRTPARPALLPALARLVLPRPVWGETLPLALIELTGAVFFALWWPGRTPGWQGFLPALWFCFFALIAAADLAARWVPNALVYPAAVAALVGHALAADLPLLASILGGALAFGVFALARLVSPGGLGGGDVKLAALMGLLFGFPNVLWALLVGGTLGALLAVALLAGRRGGKSMQIAYAPFLCIGAVAALVYSPLPSYLKL